jgi:hypothetical protein
VFDTYLTGRTQTNVRDVFGVREPPRTGGSTDDQQLGDFSQDITSRLAGPSVRSTPFRGRTRC